VVHKKKTVLNILSQLGRPAFVLVFSPVMKSRFS